MASPHDDTTDAINVDNRPTTPIQNKNFTRPTRTRRRSPLLSFLLFLFGIVLGILITLLFIISSARDNAPVPTQVSTQSSSILVQVSSRYLTQLVSSKLKTAGLVGDISNVRVTMASNNQIQITGEDTFQLLILRVTRPFTVVLQPTIEACQPRIHVISANLSDIPVTAFATTYEGQINQQIQFKASDLPAGFIYCATNVRTDPNTLYLTYAATPS